MTPKTKPKQVEAHLTQALVVARSLGLTDREAETLSVACIWESTDPASFCRGAVQDGLLRVLENLRGIATEYDVGPELAFARN